MAVTPKGDAYRSARSSGESDILTAPWKFLASETFGRDWQRSSSQTDVSLWQEGRKKLAFGSGFEIAKIAL